MPVPSFAERSYSMRPLDDAVAADLQRVAASLAARRAVFFTGSGSSAGDPTNLPTGPELAELAIDALEEDGMADIVAGVADKWDLGKIAQAVEDRLGRAHLIRLLLRLVEWIPSQFNLVHYALALLFAEGAIDRGFTANW